MLYKAFIKIILLAILCIGVVFAENQDGTGNPRVAVAVDTGEQVVIQVQMSGYTLVSRVNIVAGYGNAPLDATGNGAYSLQPNWGRVEVLESCGWLDVVVYQNTSAGEQEVLVTSEYTGHCR